MTGTLKETKKWYRRKRFWLVVILVLLVYFCFVPSRLRISPETTGITEPLTADGRVDYFAAFEETYIDKLSPPEDNGQRLIIAAIGPRVLEQPFLADSVGAWENMQTHEDSKKWFNNYWIPLCEHLYIDPYKKPMFYEKLSFHSYMYKYLKEQKKAAGENDNKKITDTETDPEKLYKKLTAGIWKKEDHPGVGKWLDDYSEVLDYFGMCVRKPNFACWRIHPPDGNLTAIILPDVQATREFARSLNIRICERLGRGDIDGAWHDIMTMKYLARHLVNGETLVTNLVGISISYTAANATKLLLIHCRPNEKQLAKFISDLNTLPKYDPLVSSLNIERLVLLQAITSCKNKKYFESLFDGMDTNNAHTWMLKLILRFPFDANIAGKHLTKIYKEFDLQDKKHIASNPVFRRKYGEQHEKIIQKYHDKFNLDEMKFMKQFYRMPLIRTRSELFAECIFSYWAPAISSAFIAFDRYEALNEMQRLAINLERYKLANGKYPDKLDDLVPKYIDIVPIDPCTGRSTFVYKLNAPAKETIDAKQIAETKTPEPPNLNYILYSLGPNRKDDNGTQLGKSKDFDIVF
ncbi:MAG: hypothetical protein LBP59_18580 [Planctomycetaceae bacterium]|jgi:hypothetical protein|nr:hypothetical protein [Planctomycetaceae bacterium]